MSLVYLSIPLASKARDYFAYGFNAPFKDYNNFPLDLVHAVVSFEVGERAAPVLFMQLRDFTAHACPAVPAERFGERKIDREALVTILEEAIAFALSFDPYMPPCTENRRVTVDQFNTKMDNSKFVTGKRLGYEYEL